MIPEQFLQQFFPQLQEYLRNFCLKKQKEKEQKILYIAVMVKNKEKELLYYHPFYPTQSQPTIPKELKIFHPKQWSLQNFIIGKFLGNGKFGKVYIARQKKSKLILALKCLQKRRMAEQQVLNQVRRQIQIQSHLKHKNILSMYGFFYDENRVYIMMEYAAYGDLYQFLKKNNKRFDEPTVKIYMKQMLEAFLYLQQNNILHRDLKPQNIMVSQKNVLKLSDFGWSVKSNSRLRDTFCGTPEYFCPEIVQYRSFDKKVDNWSLGILAYELLCGITPFYASHQKMYNKIVNNQIDFPNFASQLFKDFVRKLTRKNPKQRMQISEALKHPWLMEIIMDEQIKQ